MSTRRDASNVTAWRRDRNSSRFSLPLRRGRADADHRFAGRATFRRRDATRRVATRRRADLLAARPSSRPDGRVPSSSRVERVVSRREGLAGGGGWWAAPYSRRHAHARRAPSVVLLLTFAGAAVCPRVQVAPAPAPAHSPSFCGRLDGWRTLRAASPSLPPPPPPLSTRSYAPRRPSGRRECRPVARGPTPPLARSFARACGRSVHAPRSPFSGLSSLASRLSSGVRHATFPSANASWPRRLLHRAAVRCPTPVSI